MDKRLITRIDLERVGSTGIIVRSWFQGWNRDDAGAPDSEDYIESGSIPALLAEYEKQGFCVWQASGSQGRALRGKITRVDVIEDGDMWRVRKFCFGWSAKTPPIEQKTLSNEQAESAIQWLKENNWTVYQYTDRCVAFLGKPQPIHDRGTILALRRKAESQRVNYGINFAFYPA